MQKTKMRYCGLVTDESYNKAVLMLSPIQRESVRLSDKKYNWKYEEGLTKLYSIRRGNRIYMDEINIK